MFNKFINLYPFSLLHNCYTYSYEFHRNSMDSTGFFWIPTERKGINLMEKTTLKDIADKAGVSMMTVSNVINGKSSRVSSRTADKINAIIKECGYVPNLSARSLTSKTSNIIGVILSVDTYEENSLENPYISTMLGVIERELAKNGYYMMLRSVSWESDVSQFLRNWNVDGIIFLFPYFERYAGEFIAKPSCPFVAFDTYLQIPKIINILSDDKKGLYLSTKYMVNRGHSHIAFVANYENNELLTQRFLGYKQALEECGIPFRPEYVLNNIPSYEGGLAAGKKIASMNEGITAVVTTADICAIGIMEGARLGGLRVPIDLSVIGYDDLSLCRFTTPKLTSISQNVELKAQTAIKLLLEKILAGNNDDPCQITLDVELVERQSVISLF